MEASVRAEAHAELPSIAVVVVAGGVKVGAGVEVAATGVDYVVAAWEGQMGEGLMAALMEAHTTPPLPRRRPACRYQR